MEIFGARIFASLDIYKNLDSMPAQAIPFRDERVHARDSWQRGWVTPTALPSLVFFSFFFS